MIVCKFCKKEIHFKKDKKDKWAALEPGFVDLEDADDEEWLMGADGKWIKIKAEWQTKTPEWLKDFRGWRRHDCPARPKS